MGQGREVTGAYIVNPKPMTQVFFSKKSGSFGTISDSRMVRFAKERHSGFGRLCVGGRHVNLEGHQGTQYLNWRQSQNKLKASTLFSEKEDKVNPPQLKKEPESSVASGFSQRKAVLAAPASSLQGHVFSPLDSLLVRISDQGPRSLCSLHTKSLGDFTNAGQRNVQK